MRACVSKVMFFIFLVRKEKQGFLNSEDEHIAHTYKFEFYFIELSFEFL